MRIPPDMKPIDRCRLRIMIRLSNERDSRNQGKPTSMNGDTMTTKAAAAYLGVSTGTLANWRCSGSPAIPFIKIGRVVRYRKADLERFMQQSRRTHTA